MEQVTDEIDSEIKSGGYPENTPKTAFLLNRHFTTDDFVVASSHLDRYGVSNDQQSEFTFYKFRGRYFKVKK